MRCSERMERFSGFLIPEIGLRISADPSFFCPLSKRFVLITDSIRPQSKPRTEASMEVMTRIAHNGDVRVDSYLI